jgi:hypothetical protein
MRIITRGQILLFASLVVGLAALWVGAAPLAIQGDLVTGGVTIILLGDDVWVATDVFNDGSSCKWTTYFYCNLVPSPGWGAWCWGGPILGFVAGEGETPRASSTNHICDGPGPLHDCWDKIYEANCS